MHNHGHTQGPQNGAVPVDDNGPLPAGCQQRPDHLQKGRIAADGLEGADCINRVVARDVLALFKVPPDGVSVLENDKRGVADASCAAQLFR